MAQDPMKVGQALLEGRIDLALWHESNELAATIREINHFCHTRDKALDIQVRFVRGDIEWTIHNFNMDCIPLQGWSWSDPNLYNGQPTLPKAWQVFQEELKRG